jgi:hypothetical protein
LKKPSAEEIKTWIKGNKIKVVLSAFLLLAVLISSFLYINRPAIGVTHMITGEGQNSLIEIEVASHKGSTVTMYRDKTFIIESISQGDGRVTIDKTESQPVGDSGKVAFKIFPNELKSGVNTIHFKVKSPVGLGKEYFYTLEKQETPPTLLVQVTDAVINNENVKTFSIVTDPLNKITIAGLVDSYYSKTGNDKLNISTYQILQLMGKKPEDLPDMVQTDVNVKATNVDGKEASQTFKISLPTAAPLVVGKIEDTEADSAVITGQAPPGAIINASGCQSMANDTGNFDISLPLPVYGANSFKLAAGRPGEKKSVQNLTVNRLMPKLDLTVDEVTGDRELTIKGSVSQEASVSVNGTPAVIEKNKYFWSFVYPAGISKKYTFTVRAEKEGCRTSEMTINTDQNPVYRQ